MEEHVEKRYRLTMAWNYEKEEEWLNEMSRRGLHFNQAGMIRSAFVRDDKVRYTYGMDYQVGLRRSGKLEEYIELYRDAGWEYVSSYGEMWHYFRREWQPGEVPRLYTDRASLAGQYKKIQRVVGVMLLLNLIIFLANMMNLLPRLYDRLWGIIVPVAAIYAALFILLGYGYVKMGKKINKMTK